MKQLIKHLKTIHNHRKYVRRACFKMGLFYQGLVHDLSKYSITELKIARYYTGTCSPHKRCRDLIGYSPSWIHHYHRNKHHWEYWLDDTDEGKFVPIKIPYKYIIESFCDFIGAGKAYLKKNWTAKTPYEYWVNKCKGKRIMHKQSENLLESLIIKLKELGETDFYKWYLNNRKYLKMSYLVKNDNNCQ